VPSNFQSFPAERWKLLLVLPKAVHSMPASASFSTVSGLFGSVPPAIGVTSKGFLGPLTYDLLSELAGEPPLHAVQLHLTVSSVVNLPHPDELALPMSRRFAEDARTTDAAAVRADILTLEGPGRFLGGAHDGLYRSHSYRNNGQNYFHGFFSSNEGSVQRKT
jgi:hypothetical protein